MRLVFFTILMISVINKSMAHIHKKTQYFLDIELSKTNFLMDCSGGLENNYSIVGFHLLDGDTYYFSYYRRVWPMKECQQLQKEYLNLMKEHATVRVVIDHPTESRMADKNREEWPRPFNGAKKLISGPFIRLQAGNKCKAYFSEDCDLPKNYWGGVMPEK